MLKLLSAIVKAEVMGICITSKWHEQVYYSKRLGNEGNRYVLGGLLGDPLERLGN